MTNLENTFIEGFEIEELEDAGLHIFHEDELSNGGDSSLPSFIVSKEIEISDPVRADKSPVITKKYKKEKKETDDSLGLYLVDIGEYPLIDKDKEFELGMKIQKGLRASKAIENDNLSHEVMQQLQNDIILGGKAKNEFVCANLRLVVNIAWKYKRKRPELDMMTMIQEGNIGLMHAVEKFDPLKGFKFSTYGTWWIKQSITRSNNEQRLIRLPNEKAEKLSTYTQARIELDLQESTIGKKQSEKDAIIANNLFMNDEDFKDIVEIQRLGPTSFDKAVDQTSDNQLGLIDFIRDSHSDQLLDQVEIEIDNERELAEWKKCLTEDEFIVITRSLGVLSLDDFNGNKNGFSKFNNKQSTLKQQLSEHLGKTKVRIREIETRAMMKLARRNIIPTLLKNFDLSHEQTQVLDIYFMSTLNDYDEIKEAFPEYQPKIIFESISESAQQLLISIYGREKIVEVIRDVCMKNGFEVPNKNNHNISRQYNVMLKRFGLNSPIKDSNMRLRSKINKSMPYCNLESEILIKLVNENQFNSD